MRELKFRAWDAVRGEMLTVDELRLYGVDNAHIFVKGQGWLNAGAGVVMQFTGLLDKNGKEVYEGDVLGERGNLNRVGLVRYEPNIASFMVFVDGGYCHLNEGDWGNGPQLKYTEVIGNIYEHSHLLK